MAAYTDTTFYTNTYLGTAIASIDFARLALRASAEIDRVTFNRASAIVEAATDTSTIELIEMATCAVAEELQKDVNNGGVDNVTSERVGNYSVSFGDKSSSAMSLEDKINKAAKLYLGSTGLMFRGFADGEYAGQC